jgi:nucleoside-diphosphate-sugar epimerase
MSPPDVLVTGACGHLGYALMLSLPNYGYSPVGIDILPSSQNDGHQVHVGSISDPEFCASVFQQYPTIRYVLHTATLHKPHVGTHSKSDFINTNIRGTLNLLEAAATHQPNQIQGFIFTSTTSTFGKALAPHAGQPAAWINEQVVPVPKNIYGTTKVAAEDLCQLIQFETGMPTLVLRTSRFFPEEDDDEKARALYEDDNLKVCELLYRRVDVQDVVSAHVCAMREAKEIGWGKYIISAPPPFTKSTELLSLLDSNAAEAISQVLPVHAKMLVDRGWKLPARLDRVYDSRKAISELNWTPEYTFERAVELVAEGKDWKSPLTGRMGKRGYHAQPTGVYTK